MIKFEINNKELKTLIDKASTIIPKKTAFEPIRTLCFNYHNGELTIHATDSDQWLSVKCMCNGSDGKLDFYIHIDDITPIVKLQGNNYITFTVDSEESKSITLKYGNKTITIPTYDLREVDKVHYIDIPHTEMTEVFTIRENYILETLLKLYPATEKTGNNKMLECFNINNAYKRIEALDGYYIITRNYNDNVVEVNSSVDNVVLHNMCIPVFKKLMDKKNNEFIQVLMTDKYIIVSGTDYRYIQCIIEGKYYDIEKMLPTGGTINTQISIMPDVSKFMDILKYDTDICLKKNNLNPFCLYCKNGEMYSYMQSVRCKLLDKLEITKSITLTEDHCIGFNPQFMYNVLSAIDSDDVVISCGSSREIITITDNNNEYKCIVLPINIKNIENIDFSDSIRKEIEKTA